MNDLIPILISGFFVAAASGITGSFLILRKMALISDALSHVALPGIALGIIFNFQPVIGGLFFLFLAAFLIWRIEHKTKLAVESITGVLFVTALALGSLLIEEHELLETFFGSVENINLFQVIFQGLIAIIIIFFSLKYLKQLLLVSIAPDLAVAEKISRTKTELMLLVLIALTITIGINFVGVLLISALSIIPAATARNLSQNYRNFLILSVILAVISLTGGIIYSQFFNINPGIATVLISAAFFVFSLFKKQ